MYKILLTLFALLSLSISRAQTPEPVKPLTPKELSERLVPKLKMAAFLPITTITYELILELRKKERATAVPKLTNADSLDISFINVPGLNAGDPEIPVRIYRPKNLKKGALFLWCHGGGFVAGELNSDHQRCANTALGAGVVVISVDYRLAPEHKFPAGVNDAYASLLWSVKHAAEIGIDTARIGVGGGSAGAGIVGSLVLMTREEKRFKISLQVLLFPPADTDTGRVSVRELWNIPGIKGADIGLLTKMYTGVDAGKPLPENVLPGLAKDFKGLPATYIVTCGVDPLRDGGLVYAQKLLESGVAVELHNYPGYPHGLLPDRNAAEIYTVIGQYLNGKSF
jgi:acetyl esterase